MTIYDQIRRSTYGAEFVSACGSIDAALAIIGIQDRMLIVDQETSLTASTTVPENVHLQVNPTGLIKTAGNNLIINGSLTPTMNQMFDTSAGGVVSGFVKVLELFPQWWGAVGDDAHDDYLALQQWADAGAYGVKGAVSGYRVLRLPAGKYRYTQTLQLNQCAFIKGVGMLDGGSELFYYGADATDAVHIGTPGGIAPGQSGGGLEDVGVRDKRVGATAGSGVVFENVDNFSGGRLLVKDFPTNQIYFGAPAGQAGDNFRLYDSWVISDKANSIGILVERFDNTVNLDGIFADVNGGGCVIKSQNVSASGAVLNIRNVKHETQDNVTKTIILQGSTYGSVHIENVIQRPHTWLGGVVGSPVVSIQGTGGGPEVVLINISGYNHNVWGVAPCLIENAITGAGNRWGQLGTYNVPFALISRSGRNVQFFCSDGSPQGRVVGNVGDFCFRSDGSFGNAGLWWKAYGAGTDLGWSPWWALLDGTAVISPNIADGAVATFDVTVTDIANTSVCQAFLRGEVLPDGIILTAGYKAANTAKVNILNLTGGVFAPGNITLGVRAVAS